MSTSVALFVSDLEAISVALFVSDLETIICSSLCVRLWIAIFGLVVRLTVIKRQLGL